MKKFSFELQEVLDFRKFEQEQAEIELGKSLAVENEINQNLQTIAAQYINANSQIKGHVEFEDMMAHSQYTKLLDFQKEELLDQLTKQKVISDEKRDILRECMKKTNALEKLKEKQLQDYKEAVSKEENSFIDELGSQGYFRKNKPQET